MNDRFDDLDSSPQPKAPARRSKLQEAFSLDRIVYLAFNAFAFTLGLVLPLFTPKEEAGAYHPMADRLRDYPFALAVALVVVAGASAATGFVMVRFFGRRSRTHRVLVKWLILFLPPLAAGQVGALALSAWGAYELSSKDFALTAVSATSYAFAAIAGTVALRSSPEYDRGR